GKERAELEQHPHFPAQRVEPGRAQRCNVRAQNERGTGRWTQCTANDPQQRRLAASGLPHDREDLALRHPHGHVVQHAPCGALPERFSPPYYLKGGEFIEMTLTLGGNRYERASAERQLGELGLEPAVLDRPVRQLSKGMTQKLGLAANLLFARDLYILDEPMSGLDPASRIAVKSALERLHRDGRAVFSTSHVRADVHAL